MRALALSVLVASGCGTYITAGVDSTSKISGALAAPMSQAAVSDPRIASAAATAGTETTTMAPATGKTYSLGVGWGVSQFAIGFALQAHDVDKSTFTSTDVSSPRYATATASLDIQWTPIKWSVFSSFVHAGPTYGLLIERTSGDHDMGKGLRFGGGIAVDLQVATVFLDLYQMELSFDSGPAQGISTLRGATIGIGFNK